MKYNVWLVKYEKIVVEAESEDEVPDIAYEILEDKCARNCEDIDDYEIGDIEEVKE